MKKTLILIIGLLLLTVACVDPNSDPGDDSAKERKERAAKAKTDLNNIAITANGLSCLVSALDENLTVNSVEAIADGWIITLFNGATATIKNAFVGDIPSIGITKVEGKLVWTVNGTVIKGKDGNPVNVAASIPEFKFENDTWKYRVAGGAWTECGSAVSKGVTVAEDDDCVTVTVGDTFIKIDKTIYGVVVLVDPLPIV